MKKEIEIQRIRKRYLKEIVCQSRKWLVMAGIAMLILSIYNIVISWLLQTIIDIVSGDSSMTILQVGIIAMITFLIFIAAYVIYRVARPKYLYQAMLCYKQKIFCKMIDKNLSSFRKENTSQYLSMYTNDAKMIEMYYFDSVLEMIDLTVSFVGALLLMLWYSPILTVFGLILSVLPIAASFPIANKMAEAERKVSDGNGEFVSIVRDILQRRKHQFVGNSSKCNDAIGNFSDRSLDVSFRIWCYTGDCVGISSINELCDFPDREDTVYFGKAKSRDWVD